MCGTCSGHFFWFTNTFFTKKISGTFLKNKNKFKNFWKNLVTGSNSHMSNFFALGAIFPIFQKTKKIAKKRQNAIKKPIKPFFDVRNVFRTLFLVYNTFFTKKFSGTFLKNKNKFKNFWKNLVTGSNSHMSNFFALGAIFPIFQKTKKIAKKRQSVIKKPIKPFFEVRNVFRTLFLVYQHIFHKKIFGHIFEK
ncbi:unnamed protein product [Trypanosoma congolense IL3000]|uniref:WGS project CAEQ00000000 data, annotated contig 2297 n=1 Tax=Trypanosoma congolense (strain IL3000) TaxID=1068625 RepID=F9WCZ4_TRYCI|nr:unnamed protein product [Trypanosoma congolense IL3000]